MGDTIIPQQSEKTALDKTADKKRQQMLELGRRFMREISAFHANEKENFTTDVVFGAIDYVVKLYKQRLNAVGEDFFLLEKTVREAKLTIHEPYNNDGKESKDSILDQLQQVE